MPQLRDPERAARIKQLRKDNHLSQVALAELVGVSERAVQEWEKGVEPSWPNIVQLSRVLRTSREHLLGIPDGESAGEQDPLVVRISRLESEQERRGDDRQLLTRLAGIDHRLGELSELLRELALAQQELSVVVSRQLPEASAPGTTAAASKPRRRAAGRPRA